MKKRLSHFAYNERSRSSWTLTIPHFTPLSPIRSTIKTVTYVPGTFVTLVSGPHKGGLQGDLNLLTASGDEGGISGFFASLASWRRKFLKLFCQTSQTDDLRM